MKINKKPKTVIDKSKKQKLAKRKTNYLKRLKELGNRVIIDDYKELTIEMGLTIEEIKLLSEIAVLEIQMGATKSDEIVKKINERFPDFTREQIIYAIGYESFIYDKKLKNIENRRQAIKKEMDECEEALLALKRKIEKRQKKDEDEAKESEFINKLHQRLIDIADAIKDSNILEAIILKSEFDRFIDEIDLDNFDDSELAKIGKLEIAINNKINQEEKNCSSTQKSKFVQKQKIFEEEKVLAKAYNRLSEINDSIYVDPEGDSDVVAKGYLEKLKEFDKIVKENNFKEKMKAEIEDVREELEKDIKKTFGLEKEQ